MVMTAGESITADHSYRSHWNEAVANTRGDTLEDHSERRARAWLLAGNGKTIALVDLNSGCSVNVIQLRDRAYGIACGPDGRLYTIADALTSEARLHIYDPGPGCEFVCRNHLGARGIVALDFLRGRLFGASCLSDCLYAIDIIEGTAAVDGRLHTGPVQDIAFDARDTLWALSGSELWRADPASREVTCPGAVTGTRGKPSVLFFDNEGRLYMADSTEESRLYTLDERTLVARDLGPLPVGSVQAGGPERTAITAWPISSAFEQVGGGTQSSSA